jgi:hypothetical protein
MTVGRNLKLATIGVLCILIGFAIGRIAGLVGSWPQIQLAAFAALTGILLGRALLDEHGRVRSRKGLVLVLFVLFLTVIIVATVIWRVVATSTDL